MLLWLSMGGEQPMDLCLISYSLFISFRADQVNILDLILMTILTVLGH